MSEPFVGEIKLAAYSFAPRGYALCDGQQLNISQNTTLFSLLGTTYGGDGRVNFNLPDMRGRVPVHFGQGPGLRHYQQGPGHGREHVALTTNEMPTHNHSATTVIRADALPANIGTPTGAVLAEGLTDTIYNNAPTALVELAPETATTTTDPAGNGRDFDILQPYCVVNFSIALIGIYPSRN